MIVRDETAVLERLFESIHPVIDAFVIVDTGSTDGTPELIESLAHRHGIPGEVHFRDWVDFGTNRQQALELASLSERGDWLLFMDADDELAQSDPQWFRQLQPGQSYSLEKRHDGMHYALHNLIWWRGRTWRWQGVVHEALTATPTLTGVKRITGAWIIHHTGQGARSQGVSLAEKYRRDALRLEQALAGNPDDARARFYLAQSWRDAGEPEKALENYAKRTQMGGWAEEQYVAWFEQIRLMIELNQDHRAIMETGLTAFAHRPWRAEVPWLLARHCRSTQKYADGYLFAAAARDLPLPADDILFVRKDVYDWRLLDEYAICAYWIGRHQESAAAGKRLLKQARYPVSEDARIRRNLKFAMDRIAQDASVNSKTS